MACGHHQKICQAIECMLEAEINHGFVVLDHELDVYAYLECLSLLPRTINDEPASMAPAYLAFVRG